jgi:oligopeptide/dipeptide ABC transporter ATP-binding protein
MSPRGIVTTETSSPAATFNAAPDQVVSIRDVSVRFVKGPPWRRVAVEAVRNVSLEIARGETLGLVGESGSGKTTIAKVMMGLVLPTTGAVRFGDAGQIQDRPRGSIQVVLQNPDQSLNPRHSIARCMAEPIVIARTANRSARAALVGEMLERVGLPRSYGDRHPGELSGGQRQRVAIGRALITNPQLIVFDEAVTALDVSVQAQILNLIKDLQAERSFAALFISHDLAVVRYVSARIAVMYAGEVVEAGPAHRFYGTQQHPYSVALAAAAELAGSSSTGTDVLDIPPDGCPFRPRCPLANAVCLERPELRSIEKAQVACHHVG